MRQTLLVNGIACRYDYTSSIMRHVEEISVLDEELQWVTPQDVGAGFRR